MGVEREAAALVGVFLGFGDQFERILVATYTGVDPEVERLKEAKGMLFEEDLDAGGIMVMIEQGNRFPDELDGGFEEAAV